NAVESAMTQHLQEISESVQLIRQENSGWFSEE
ncbi:TPA: GntR family transcriptional regulator, partial [Salmonella enterica subsp. enterica serovar Typhimurium]|nr:GntR family transcriptional regulator [Salmonella enterica subsp. enterica serovar Typhimurium]